MTTETIIHNLKQKRQTLIDERASIIDRIIELGWAKKKKVQFDPMSESLSMNSSYISSDSIDYTKYAWNDKKNIEKGSKMIFALDNAIETLEKMQYIENNTMQNDIVEYLSAYHLE